MFFLVLYDAKFDLQVDSPCYLASEMPIEE